MEKLLQRVASYLHEVLGVSVMPELWPVSNRLPFFLQDTFHFFTVTLLGTPCLLLSDRIEREINPLALARYIRQVRQQWDGEVVYLGEAVSPYARKRLIEQKIPFIIPGNQLFLPSLGMDLREFYKKHHPSVSAVSPSSQVVIIYALQNAHEQPFTPSALAKRLGYTRMTMARAFDELESLDIGEIVSQRKERLFRVPHGAQDLWQHARDVMRSPVKKRLWTLPPVSEWRGVPAGLSALASYTMLAAPDRQVYAMSSAEWIAWNKRWKNSRIGVPEFEIPEQDEMSCGLELWSYSPRLFAETDRVDPFSLYLSLQSQQDERVQSALTQMMEQVLW